MVEVRSAAEARKQELSPQERLIALFNYQAADPEQAAWAILLFFVITAVGTAVLVSSGRGVLHFSQGKARTGGAWSGDSALSFC